MDFVLEEIEEIGKLDEIEEKEGNTTDEPGDLPERTQVGGNQPDSINSAEPESDGDEDPADSSADSAAEGEDEDEGDDVVSDVDIEDENSLRGEIVIYRTDDSAIALDVPVENETVWLTQRQLQELFGRDVSGISRHISNVFKDGEVEKEGNVRYVRSERTGKPVAYYSLDVIISVGYRVKSKSAIKFRKWANGVLRDYIIKGYAANEARLRQLSEAIQIMKRTSSLEASQIFDVIDSYSGALDLLDDYDHQRISRPKGEAAAYVLTYEECREFIDGMKFSADSDLFGNEKDDSFKSSISSIYQTFFGEDLYPSMEEKAANLLYLVTKNHSFSDGNKRIAAGLFIYFLDKNDILFKENGEKTISDYTLVAITLMIAESRADEKETMISLIMNFLH